MSIAPVIAKTRIAGELGDRQAARDEVVRPEHDRHRDDGDEQKVEEGRQGVDLVAAAERRDRRRRSRPRWSGRP